MKLLYINYEFPPIGGGGGRANAQIAKEMAALGHEVVVLTASFRRLAREEKRDGYRILRMPTLRRHQEKCRVFEMLAFMLMAPLYALRLVRQWKPDISIAFFTIPSAPAALILKKICKIPFIVSLRGGDVPGFKSGNLWIYHWITTRFIRYMWREAKAVVANSHGLKTLALQTESELDILTIPNGVDPFFLHPMESHAQIMSGSLIPNQGDKAFRILSVGRLSPQKGLDDLLLSFWELKKKVQQKMQLWIVGDGPLRKNLERLAIDLQIQNEVFFFGWHDPLTLKHFYASADLFVLPSLAEGMPNAVLEAMAMGLPVVATDVLGTRDLVIPGVNGFLVWPRHTASFSDAMLQLVQNDCLRVQFSKGARLTAQNYNWQHAAHGYLKLCKQAA